MHIGTIKEIWRYPVKSMGGEQVQSCQVQAKGVADDRCWSVRDDLTGEIVGGRKIPGLMMLTACYSGPVQTRFGEAVTGGVKLTLPDGQTIDSDDPYASALLSMYLGRKVTLIPRPTPKQKSAYKLAKPMTPAEVRYALGMKPSDPDPDFSSFSLKMLATLSQYATPPGVLYDVYPLHLMTTSALEWISQFHPEGDFSVRRYRPNFLIQTAPEFEGIVENDWRGRDLQIGDLRITCNHPTIRCSMPGAAQPGLPQDAAIPLTLMKYAGQHLGAYATPVNEAQIQVGDTIELLPESRNKAYSWFDQVGRRAKSKILKVNNWVGDFIDQKGRKKSTDAILPGFEALRVLDKTREADDVVSVTLGRSDGAELTRFIPGQHVVLAIPQANDKLTYRPYSISSGSNRLDHYRISVKLKTQSDVQEQGAGEVSGFIHQSLQPGATLYAKGPSGQFGIRPADTTPLVLISSGIGITPFLSILHTLATEHPTRSVRLIHGIRHADAFPFKEELQSLANKLSNLKLELWVSGSGATVSGPEADATSHLGLSYNKGRIKLSESLNSTDPQARFLVRGSPAFSRDMHNDLLTAGISPKQLMTESFGMSQITADNDEQQTKPFEVIFKRSGKKAIWTAGTSSLLTLAEEQGLQPGSGCRYGACQACEATLLSGSVHYPEGVQPPAGKNKILLCSARPASDLKISIE